MPKESTILCMKLQYGYPVIWALVYPDNDVEERFFIGIGTGDPIDSYILREYIGTVLMNEDKFVYHVFEIFYPPDEVVPHDAPYIDQEGRVHEERSC